MLETLENLFKLARERKNNPIKGSYTNKLLNDRKHQRPHEFYLYLFLRLPPIPQFLLKLLPYLMIYRLIMYMEAYDLKIEDVMAELEKRKK